jgi:hypothetical protein
MVDVEGNVVRENGPKAFQFFAKTLKNVLYSLSPLSLNIYCCRRLSDDTYFSKVKQLDLCFNQLF